MPEVSLEEGGENSNWWFGAIISPIASAALGILVGISTPKRESDWLGMGAIWTAGLVLSVGCLLSVICREVSRRKREKLAFLANLGAWPSMVWLAFVLVVIIAKVFFHP